MASRFARDAIVTLRFSLRVASAIAKAGYAAWAQSKIFARSSSAALRRCVKNKQINHRSRSSYGLKHVCENWARRIGVRGYVSNGAMLVAALELGMAIKLYENCPNALVDIRLASVAALMKEGDGSHDPHLTLAATSGHRCRGDDYCFNPRYSPLAFCVSTAA